MSYNDLIEIISARSGAMRAGTFGLLGAGAFIGGVDCVHANLSRKIAAAFHDAFVS